MTQSINDSATLDPPGTIAVVGAGPIGIEAALYGRFLGYEVTLIESEAIGHSLIPRRDAALPMLPDRCVSSLAIAAIEAQYPDQPPITLPVTVAEWIDRILVPLTETDLLRGRLRAPFRVTNIQQIATESDESEDDIPPDFRLSLAGVDGQSDEIEVEAVILAIGTSAKIECEFPLPSDYLFRIGEASTDDAEADFRGGLREITQAYASLAGRETLDLYRPQRI